MSLPIKSLLRALKRDLERVALMAVREIRGAFFLKSSGYSHSGLGITEYTEYQFPKERIF